MSAIHTDRFTIGKNSYVIPHYLGISEARPPVHLALQQKLRHGPPAGGDEQRLTSVGIIKGYLRALLGLLALLPEGCLLKVSTVLGVLRFVHVQMGGGKISAKRETYAKSNHTISRQCEFTHVAIVLWINKGRDEQGGSS